MYATIKKMRVRDGGFQYRLELENCCGSGSDKLIFVLTAKDDFEALEVANSLKKIIDAKTLDNLDVDEKIQNNS